MKSAPGLIALIVAVVMIFIQFGGNKTVNQIYDSQPHVPKNAAPLPEGWPPRLDKAYPELALVDQDGMSFQLSDYKGKVIIIEPIGMNCPACQAYSGAHDYGAYRGNAVEQHSQSYRKIFEQYAQGLKLPAKDLIFIQILFYDFGMGTPQQEDAKLWAEHFQLQKSENHIVAISPQDLRSADTFNMIPGFQLIDRNFILRADASGHKPKNDLYKTLVPMVPLALNAQ